MKQLDFEVRSGRPVQIIVQDVDGKKWAISCGLSVIDIKAKGGKNPDGSPQFDVNLGIAFQTVPFEQQ